MHDKLFKQGKVGEEWGKGKGRGGVLIVSHNHISHELSSEANHGFEGYSDYKRLGRSSGTSVSCQNICEIYYL